MINPYHLLTATFYAATALLLLALFGSRLPRRLQPALARLDGRIERLRPRHLYAMCFAGAAVWASLHAWTLWRAGGPDRTDHFVDNSTWFRAMAEALLAGGNPWSDPAQPLAHGILFVLLCAAAVAAGGTTAMIQFWTLTNFLLPAIVRPLARQYLGDARRANYAALIILMFPPAVVLNAHTAQEDGLVAVGIAAAILLIARRHFFAAAVLAALLGHLKTPVLLLTAPLLALSVAQARKEGRPLGPAFWASVRRGALAGAAFAAGALLTWWFFGGAYLSQVFGLVVPGESQPLLPVSGFTWVGLFHGDQRLKPWLNALEAVGFLAALGFLWAGVRRPDPVAGGALLTTVFYLTGFFVSEHYAVWGLPTLFVWALATRRGAAVLAVAGVGVLAHAWGLSEWGVVDLPGQNAAAEVLSTLLLLGILAALVVWLRSPAADDVATV